MKYLAMRGGGRYHFAASQQNVLPGGRELRWCPAGGRQWWWWEPWWSRRWRDSSSASTSAVENPPPATTGHGRYISLQSRRGLTEYSDILSLRETIMTTLDYWLPPPPYHLPDTERQEDHRPLWLSANTEGLLSQSALESSSSSLLTMISLPPS